MLVYCSHITPRLQYIIEFISKELFDEPIRITPDKEAFIRSAEPKLNYSAEETGGEEFFIQNTPLLFESAIAPRAIECFELNYHKAFFETSGDFPFDIFAASFYLLSRYEEYLPHEKDITQHRLHPLRGRIACGGDGGVSRRRANVDWQHICFRHR